MYLIFDIGATKTRISTTEDCATFSDPIIADTPKLFNDGVHLVIDTALRLSGGKPFKGVTGGLPGPLLTNNTGLFRGPHLSDWGGKSFEDPLEKALGCKVQLINDTALVGLGETHFGAGKGASIFAYITVSTGVNGVRIIDGKVDRSAYGFEIGKQLLGPVENPVTLESLISGTSISEKFDMHPSKITDPAVWDSLADYLSIGINNTIVHWSPERIAIGGSMMNVPGILIADVKKHLANKNIPFPTLPEIVKAELGAFGGLYGAMYLQSKSAL